MKMNFFIRSKHYASGQNYEKERYGKQGRNLPAKAYCFSCSSRALRKQ